MITADELLTDAEDQTQVPASAEDLLTQAETETRARRNVSLRKQLIQTRAEGDALRPAAKGASEGWYGDLANQLGISVAQGLSMAAQGINQAAAEGVDMSNVLLAGLPKLVPVVGEQLAESRALYADRARRAAQLNTELESLGSTEPGSDYARQLGATVVNMAPMMAAPGIGAAAVIGGAQAYLQGKTQAEQQYEAIPGVDAETAASAARLPALGQGLSTLFLTLAGGKTGPEALAGKRLAEETLVGTLQSKGWLAGGKHLSKEVLGEYGEEYWDQLNQNLLQWAFDPDPQKATFADALTGAMLDAQQAGEFGAILSGAAVPVKEGFSAEARRAEMLADDPRRVAIRQQVAEQTALEASLPTAAQETAAAIAAPAGVVTLDQVLGVPSGTAAPGEGVTPNAQEEVQGRAPLTPTPATEPAPGGPTPAPDALQAAPVLEVAQTPATLQTPAMEPASASGAVPGEAARFSMTPEPVSALPAVPGGATVAERGVPGALSPVASPPVEGGGPAGTPGQPGQLSQQSALAPAPTGRWPAPLSDFQWSALTAELDARYTQARAESNTPEARGLQSAWAWLNANRASPNWARRTIRYTEALYGQALQNYYRPGYRPSGERIDPWRAWPGVSEEVSRQTLAEYAALRSVLDRVLPAGVDYNALALVARFSRDYAASLGRPVANPGVGLEAAATDAVVAAWRKAHPQAPEIVVVHDPTHTSDGFGVQGFADRGRIVLNRAFVSDANEARQILNEEEAHHWLQTPNGRVALLNAFDESVREAAVTSLGAWYRIAPGETVPAWRRRLLEEFAAKAHRVEGGWMERFVERVRNWLAWAHAIKLTPEETARALVRRLRASPRLANHLAAGLPGPVQFSAGQAASLTPEYPHAPDPHTGSPSRIHGPRVNPLVGGALAQEAEVFLGRDAAQRADRLAPDDASRPGSRTPVSLESRPADVASLGLEARRLPADWRQWHTVRSTLFGRPIVGGEALGFVDSRQGVIYKTFLRYGTGVIGYQLQPRVANGRLIPGSIGASVPGLQRRFAVLNALGATPTEILGVSPQGILIVKQPLASVTQTEIGARVAELGRMRVRKIPSDLVQADAPGVDYFVALVAGQPYLLTDVHQGNFVQDNQGDARLVDAAVGVLPAEVLGALPRLQTMVNELRVQDAAQGARQPRAFSLTPNPVPGSDPRFAQLAAALNRVDLPADPAYEPVKFVERVRQDPAIAPEIRAATPELQHPVAPNELTAAQAQAFIQQIGLERAVATVKDESVPMPEHVRVALGEAALIGLNDRYAALTREQKTQAANEAENQAVDLALWLGDFGVRLGRGVQAFSMWRHLHTPEAFVKVYQRTIDKARQRLQQPGLSRKLTRKLGVKLRLPAVDPAVAKRIRAAAREALQKPSGFQRDEAVVDVLGQIARVQGIDWMDVGMGLWYANLLSGVTTQIRNAAGNLTALIGETATHIAAHPTYAADFLAGLYQGVIRGVPEAWAVLKTGKTVGAGRQAKLDALGVLELYRFKGAAYPLNAWKYVGRTMGAADMLFFSSAQEAKAHYLARLVAEREGLAGDALRTRVTELLFPKGITIEQARAQADAEKLVGTNRRRRVQELLREGRPDDLVNAATQFGRFATFNQDPEGFLGWAAGVVRQGAAKFPPIRAVVPFTNVVANVTNNGLNFTPWGYLRLFQFRNLAPDRFTGDFGDDEYRLQFARATLGTIGLSAIYALVAAGGDDEDPWFSLSAEGPTDPDRRKQLRESGWLPYGIKLGNRWYDYRAFVIAPGLAVIGNLLDARRYRKLDQADALARVAYVFMGSVNQLLNQSFLDGLADLLKNISDARIQRTGAPLQGLIRSTVGAVTPNLVKQIDRVFDPTLYDADTVQAAIAREFPVARSYAGLQPVVNVLGDPVRLAAQPFVRGRSDDGLWLLIAQKQAWISMPSKTMMVGDRPINPVEYADYVTRSGHAIRRRLEPMVPALQSLAPAAVQDIVGDVVRQERRLAKRELFGL